MHGNKVSFVARETDELETQEVSLYGWNNEKPRPALRRTWALRIGVIFGEATE